MHCDNLVAKAAEAWQCAEDDALVLMQDIATGMRQIRFEAAFWPDMQVRVQTAAASGAPLPAAFHERLAEALATLSTHDIAAMRIDFRTFPAVPDSVETRFIRLGNTDDDPRLVFRFVGARRDAPMRAVAGMHILVVCID